MKASEIDPKEGDVFYSAQSSGLNGFGEDRVLAGAFFMNGNMPCVWLGCSYIQVADLKGDDWQLLTPAPQLGPAVELSELKPCTDYFVLTDEGLRVGTTSSYGILEWQRKDGRRGTASPHVPQQTVSGLSIRSIHEFDIPLPAAPVEKSEAEKLREQIKDALFRNPPLIMNTPIHSDCIQDIADTVAAALLNREPTP
jgi:hypothetical protein